mmetsp:Transcript_39351/g.122462  ORF Transcript_39351/g.122462 Transcript_39351/m.122462 type:complete len:226 (-) Transcript_39351:200-877(-)
MVLPAPPAQGLPLAGALQQLLQGEGLAALDKLEAPALGLRKALRLGLRRPLLLGERPQLVELHLGLRDVLVAHAVLPCHTDGFCQRPLLIARGRQVQLLVGSPTLAQLARSKLALGLREKRLHGRDGLAQLLRGDRPPCERSPEPALRAQGLRGRWRHRLLWLRLRLGLWGRLGLGLHLGGGLRLGLLLGLGGGLCGRLPARRHHGRGGPQAGLQPRDLLFQLCV